MSAYVGSLKNKKDLKRGGYQDGRHEGEEGRTKLIQGAQMYHFQGCGGSQPAQSRPLALSDPEIRHATLIDTY